MVDERAGHRPRTGLHRRGKRSQARCVPISACTSSGRWRPRSRSPTPVRRPGSRPPVRRAPAPRAPITWRDGRSPQQQHHARVEQDVGSAGPRPRRERVRRRRRAAREAGRRRTPRAGGGEGALHGQSVDPPPCGPISSGTIPAPSTRCRHRRHVRRVAGRVRRCPRPGRRPARARQSAAVVPGWAPPRWTPRVRGRRGQAEGPSPPPCTGARRCSPAPGLALLGGLLVALAELEGRPG